jgi:hypothetical protein
MNNFQKLDPLRTLELNITRKGWFKTHYILTDGQFEYGRLGCVGGIFNREKRIETADGNWIIKPIGLLAKETQIIDTLKGEIIGTITRNGWDTKVTVSLNSGFNAVLAREGGIFSRKMSWGNDQLGGLIQLSTSYKFSKPFTVTFDQGVINKPVPFTLLTLIGANIILTRQAQAAAAV